MEELVKNLGLSGSQSKKKWRKNIDTVSGLTDTLGSKHTGIKVTATIKQQATKRTLLDPNRFRKKPVDMKVLSKHETR